MKCSVENHLWEAQNPYFDSKVEQYRQKSKFVLTVAVRDNFRKYCPRYNEGGFR